jgi:hypothetical protein
MCGVPVSVLWTVDVWTTCCWPVACRVLHYWPVVACGCGCTCALLLPVACWLACSMWTCHMWTLISYGYSIKTCFIIQSCTDVLILICYVSCIHGIMCDVSCIGHVDLSALVFSYSDRVRHVPYRISSFSNLLISRKFVFVFVSDLSEFDFVSVFKCESENDIRVIPTEFDRFQP